VTQKFKYRGSLDETTLPEMLYTIDRYRVPGVVEARRGGVVKRVFIRDGYIIHASSSDRRDSLGAFLKRAGTVEEKDLESLTRARETSNKRLGVLVIERGILPPATVLESIRQQIEEIVWSLFYWQEGTVTFGLGELEEEELIQIQLPIKQVIVHGIKSVPDPKPLVARLGKKETVFQPCYRPEDLIETSLAADEFQLLRQVDGEKSLYELCVAGPGSLPDNAKLIYAFRVLQLIRPRKAFASGDGPVKVQLGTAGDRM
jgi:hypothetical protein